MFTKKSFSRIANSTQNGSIEINHFQKYEEDDKGEPIYSIKIIDDNTEIK